MKLQPVSPKDISGILQKHAKILVFGLIVCAAAATAAFMLREFPGRGDIFAWARARMIYNDARGLEASYQSNKAIEKYKGALALYQQDPAFLIGLGNVYHQLGKDSEAIVSYQRALEINPANAHGWLRLSQVQLADAQVQAAEQSLAKAVQLDPKNPAVLAQKGSIWALTNRKADAEKLFAQTNVFGDSPEFWYAAGRFNLMNGQMQKAEAELRQAAALKNSPEYLRFLALALFKQRKYDEAEEHLKAAAETNPDSAINWVTLGQCYMVEKKMTEASEALKRAAELDPSNARYWKEYGKSLFLAKEYQAAEEPLYRAAHLNAKDSSIWGLLVENLRKERKYRECFEALKQYLYLGGNKSAEIWIYAADIFAEAGMENDMREAYRRALALNPPQQLQAWLVEQVQKKDLLKSHQKSPSKGRPASAATVPDATTAVQSTNPKTAPPAPDAAKEMILDLGQEPGK
jgi:tetratricopeptide (TPR) repeat protein